jgi:diguanylate cyclase (GGDEF)-like protein
MKSSISLKLTAILCLFGLLLTGLASYYSLSSSKQILLDAAKRDLLVANQVLGRNLQIKLQNFATDARLLASQPQPLQILLDSPDKARERIALASMLEALIEANSAYQGVRLIGAQQHGLELMSVDRSGVQPDSALKERGHFPYVFKTLQLASGDQYFSEITPDSKGPDGALVLQLASPVWSEQRPLGVIVLSLNVTTQLARLTKELPDYYQIFLANDKGQLLLDPDHLTTRGAASGPDVLLQEQIPSAQLLIDGKTSSLLVALPDKYNQPSRLATFTRLLVGHGEKQTPLILGLAIPEEHILRASHELDQRMIRIILGLSLLSLLLSLWLAKALLRPLNQIGHAISQFTHNLSLLPLPTKRRDELGRLARELKEMQEKILVQLGELSENHIQMQRMAHDDALTGLPNRRLFFDRLEHAIAKARRNGKQIGLLYVDLDAFKEINDTFGHAIGDEALRIVARLLISVTRESDTVARLGGDEFIILLEEMEDRTVLLSIAKKLLAHMQNRIFIGGHELQLTASLGISIFPQHGEDADALVQSADSAMYTAKREGRNRITMASEQLPG